MYVIVSTAIDMTRPNPRNTMNLTETTRPPTSSCGCGPSDTETTDTDVTPSAETIDAACATGFLDTRVPSFTAAMRAVDEALDQARTVDRKTDELIRFALSIKTRSEPCVRKHFVGAKAAGASEAEIGYVFALTMREAAGSDDCWTQGIIGDLSDAPSAACCG
jgi:AhpD family alkylhydroperoxidase